MLNLFPEDFQMARSGRRTAALLEGPRVFPLRRVETLNCEGKPSLPIIATRIEIKVVADLDEADARACGFATLARFSNHVVSTYPDLAVDATVTLIHFERVE
jgi:hypothetical protein